MISDVKNEILLSWAAGLQLCFSFFLQEVCTFLQLCSLSFFLWNSFCGLFGHFYSVFLRGIASHLLAALSVQSMSFLLNWRPSKCTMEPGLSHPGWSHSRLLVSLAICWAHRCSFRWQRALPGLVPKSNWPPFPISIVLGVIDSTKKGTDNPKSGLNKRVTCPT